MMIFRMDLALCSDLQAQIGRQAGKYLQHGGKLWYLHGARHLAVIKNLTFSPVEMY